MPDIATTTASATAGAIPSAAGIIILGVTTGLQPDILLAGACGGMMAIITLRELSRMERVYAILAALVTPSMLVPLVAVILPRLIPGLITIDDGHVVRIAVGFIIGFLAYRVLLPGLLTRAKSEIEERGK